MRLNLSLDLSNLSNRNRYYGYGYGYTKEARERNRVNQRNNVSGMIHDFIQANQAVLSRTGSTFNVEEPGFHYYYNMRDKFGSFDTIFFPEPGKYSSVSIYKNIRNNERAFVNGVFGYIPEVVDNNLGASFAGSALQLSIPAKQTSPEEVLAHEYGQSLYQELLARFRGEEIQREEARQNPDHLLINNRYKLLIFTADRIFVMRNDGSLQDYSFPHINENNQASSLHRLNRYQGIRTASRKPMWGGVNPDIDMILYSEHSQNAVWNTDLLDSAHEFLASNKEEIIASARTFRINKFTYGIELLCSLMGPTDFHKRISEYLLIKGLPNFKVVDVYPSIMMTSYTYHNWETGRGENINGIEPGYFLEIEYKGRQVIGPNSNNYYLQVKDEGDRIRLIHSAWCQHITAWSRGTTDQRYDCWEISDWLSGPFAERAGLNVEEAPAIFMGNKLSKSHKTKAIQSLRARMDRIR